MPETLAARAVLFDFYSTLVSVWTEEHRSEVWQTMARFLRYHGLSADAESLQGSFFAHADEANRLSSEPYFQTDIAEVFLTILMNLGAPQPDELVREVMWLFRATSMHHFELFPDTLPALTRLRSVFKIGLVTDAQPLFVRPELDMLDLMPLFDVVVVSGDSGIHKPDVRLFQKALTQLNLTADEVVYVGDSIERDVCGAHEANIRAILLDRFLAFDPKLSRCRPEMVIHGLRELSDLVIPMGPRGADDKPAADE